MTTDTKIHHLQNLACEDEAQSTSVSFMPVGHEVLVWSTFNGYDEWELDSERWLPKKEARALWRKLAASPEFEHTHSADVTASEWPRRRGGVDR